VRIFLDARDLINLVEGRGPCSLGEIRGRLSAGGHEVALSPTVVFEVAAPLVEPSTDTVVMRRLNALESLPVAYLADSQIGLLELTSAISSFLGGREYAPIDPYVERFDAAIPISGSAPTAAYLRHSLAETVFTIWRQKPDLLRWPTTKVDGLQAVMAADRSLTSTPSLASHFRKKLRRDLRLYGIAEPPSGVDSLADWIYQSPDRCPGLRLGYEVFHQLRRNIGDLPAASDFGDFAHVSCLPYVDLITLDRRMADYVRRSGRGWLQAPAARIRHDLASVVTEL